MNIQDKEKLVQEIISEIKKNTDAEYIYLPEVESCIFIELMKLSDETLKNKLEKK